MPGGEWVVDHDRVSAFAQRFAQLCDNVNQVVSGKADVVELLVTGLLSGGHILLEDGVELGREHVLVSSRPGVCQLRLGR